LAINPDKIDPRISFNFEFAKVASILLVVVAHFGVGMNLWIPVSVGLFIFGASSGYFTSAKYGERFSLLEYCNRKIVRMGPHVLLVNLFLLGLFLIEGRSDIWTWQTLINLVGLTGFLNWFGIPNDSPFGAGLWFFTLLLVFYAVYPALRLLSRSQIGLAAFTVLSLAACAVLNRISPMGHALWLTAWSFVFGVAVCRFNPAVPPWIAAILATVLAGVMILLNVQYGCNQLNFLFIAGIAVSTVLWLKGVQLPQRLLSPICLLSSCILEIYFLHTYLFVTATGRRAVDLTLSLVCIIIVSFLLSAAAKWMARTAACLRVQPQPRSLPCCPRSETRTE